MWFTRVSVLQLAVLSLLVTNSVAQDASSSSSILSEASSEKTKTLTSPDSANTLAATPAPTTSPSGGFSIVLPFGTIVFTKLPFFLSFGRAARKTIAPLPPVTKSLASMSICEAADTSLFPDSCLDVAPATAPITAAPSTAVLAESASSAAHATPAMPAYRKHRRGIFDLDFSADATSSSELEFSSDSIADQSTEIIGKSSSIQEAANNIAWSGIDSDSDSVGSGSSNAAKPSATVSDESGIFDIPRGNFLLTSEEGELPAGASPSSMPGTFGGPTTLIFIESGITIDVDDSRSSSGGALDQLSLPAGPTQVPLSIIQSAIMSAQTSRAVKGWHSAFGEESPATLRSDAAASFGENDLGALEKDLTAECATGMMRCAPDNMGFDTCLFGKWGTIRVCAKGTRCITLPGSSIVCA